MHRQIAFALTLAIAAQAEAQTYTTRARVNLRSEPHTASYVWRVLNANTRVYQIDDEVEDNFARVRTIRGDEGWVSLAHLRESNTFALTATLEEACTGDRECNYVPVGRNNLKPPRHTFHGCGPEGKGGDSELNYLKNRTDEGDYLAITFAALRSLPWPRTVDDYDRDEWEFDERQEVYKVEGTPIVVRAFLTYDTRTKKPVIAAHEEGKESTNCGEEGADDVDWHLWLTAGPQQTRANSIVAEVTPRVRANHPGWTMTKLRDLAREGIEVRVSGWLMLDQEHPEQLKKSGKRNKTRATLWEIHPITRFEVCEAAKACKNLDHWQLH